MEEFLVPLAVYERIIAKGEDMLRSRIDRLALVCFLMGIFFGSLLTGKVYSASSQAELQIIFSGNTQGLLEPCG